MSVQKELQLFFYKKNLYAGKKYGGGNISA